MVMDGFNALVAKHGIGDFFSISGHPGWSLLSIKDAAPYTMWQVKTLYMQEILARGILGLGTHNISYAHGEAEIATLLSVYDEVFAIIAHAVKTKTLDKRLDCKPLEPLFRVR
jgi:glutamate-1-semialdehyde 2,1-aminomutase